MDEQVNASTGMTDEQVLAGVVHYFDHPRTDDGIHPDSRTAAFHNVDPRKVALFVQEPVFAVGALRSITDEELAARELET